jgi:hypothetical protein
MRRLMLASVFAFLVLPGVFVLRAQETAQACSDSTLPEGVRAALASQYGDWRIQATRDLEAQYQKAWVKKRPAACPGIASGQFEGRAALSYAVLLIPREKGKQGYRLVVFDPSGKDSFSSAVLEQSDNYIPSDSGIFRVDPGLQFDEEKFSTFKLKSDGIYLETLDKGGFIYYWKHGRYQRVLESD